MFFMSIAYICGSMFYRLKMKYNILVFILIPGILFGVVLNILFSNSYIGDKLGTIAWSITCFVEKPIVTIVLEVLLTALKIRVGNNAKCSRFLIYVLNHLHICTYNRLICRYF